jgi:SpoVK/Ycf46/Vps4 family AAA+-type ATPase
VLAATSRPDLIDPALLRPVISNLDFILGENRKTYRIIKT